MYNNKIILNSMRTNIIFKNSNIVIAQIRDFLYENVWLCAECLGCCYRDDVMDDYDALTTHSNSKFTANIEMITKSTNFVNLDKSDTENNKDVNLTQNIECENKNKTDKNVLEQVVENVDMEIQEYDYVLYPKLDIETSNENNKDNNEKNNEENDYDIISELNKNTLTI